MEVNPVDNTIDKYAEVIWINFKDIPDNNNNTNLCMTRGVLKIRIVNNTGENYYICDSILCIKGRNSINPCQITNSSCDKFCTKLYEIKVPLENFKVLIDNPIGF